MYDNQFLIEILNNLESKVDSICDTIIALTSQGYFVNNNKRVKLDYSSILIHAFENINMFNDKQKANLELIYNNIFSV